MRKQIRFKKLRWLAGLWLVLSACNPDRNEVIVHDARWVADSARLKNTIDTLLAESNRVGNYSRFFTKLTEFSSVNVCKSHPKLVRTYFGWALASIDGASYDTVRMSRVIQLHSRFQELADSSENEYLKVWSDYFLARFYNYLNDGRNSLPRLLAVGPKFEAMNDSLGVSLVSKRIGELYVDVFADYEKAIPYYRKAMRYTNEPYEHEFCALRLGEAFLHLGKNDSARFYAGRVRDLIRVGLDILLASYDFVHHNSNDSILKNKIEALGKDSAAWHNEFFLLSFWKGANVVARNLIEAGNVEAAQWYVDQAIQYDSVCKVCHLERVPLYGNMAATYRLKNDLGNAYYWSRKQVAAMESQLDKKGNERIEEAALRFQMKELVKIQEKRSLRRQQEAQARIEEQRLWRNISLVGFAFVVALAAMGAYTTRLRRRIEIEKLRSSISRDLHDDVGSTLSSIKIISGMALEKIATPSTAKEPLSRIYERSQRLLENMNDIVWSIKPADTLEEIFARMRLFASTLFEAKEIDYQIDFPTELHNITLSLAGKNALYFSFKELVNNIARHSQATHANITIAKINSQLVLRIQDNGVGFQRPALEPGSNSVAGFGGNGLVGLEARAHMAGGELILQSAPGTGTQAELWIPL